jgi:hypothetical protein
MSSSRFHRSCVICCVVALVPKMACRAAAVPTPAPFVLGGACCGECKADCGCDRGCGCDWGGSVWGGRWEEEIDGRCWCWEAVDIGIGGRGWKVGTGPCWEPLVLAMECGVGRPIPVVPLVAVLDGPAEGLVYSPFEFMGCCCCSTESTSTSIPPRPFKSTPSSMLRGLSGKPLLPPLPCAPPSSSSSSSAWLLP